MEIPPNPFPIVQGTYRVGDAREAPTRALDALRGTDAYDSYDQVYLIDGLRWRVEGKINRADGESYYRLRCVAE